MTVKSFILKSLRYYWRGHLGLCFGAFLASAILSGSLLVGDSVRGSLRRAGEARLGRVEAGVIGGDRWFTEELVRASDGAPLILADGSVSAGTGAVRVNAVQVLGVDESFNKLSPSGEGITPGSGGVVLNESLAAKLQVGLGDSVLVRLERPSAISKDAPLSGSTHEEVTLRRTVNGVVGQEQFGFFQLAASQTAPDSVFLELSDLQLQLEMESRVNTGLFADSEALARSWGVNRQLQDFALQIEQVADSNGEWQVTSERVFVDEVLAAKMLEENPSFGVLTYLVNGIDSEAGGVPYSMAAAVDEKVLAERAKVELQADEAIITEWLAADQKLKVGDSLGLKYFVVGIGRKLEERTAKFRVAAILPMDHPLVKRDWTPNFPGVSDVDNCREWDPGVPMDLNAIREQDEQYWDEYRGTPKVFLGLQQGQELWGNRFGKLTSVRLSEDVKDEGSLRADLVGKLRLADIGLHPRDLRQSAAAAARGSVDFGGLFVGLSLFLIAAALVFAALLFLFTLERRAGQVGLLLAMGWSRGLVRWTLLAEAGLIGGIGVALGSLAGEGYTRLALAGLGTVWGGAAQGLVLSFEAAPTTRWVAAASSLAVMILTLGWVSRRLFRTPARILLSGALASGVRTTSTKSRRWPAPVAFGGALVLILLGARSNDAQVVAGTFFGAGALLLIGALLVLRSLMQPHLGSVAQSMLTIGLRGVMRRPARSLAVVGLMASGIFLVTAVNAFRLSGDEDPSRRDTGTGGFALVAESSLPIYEDLNGKAGRESFALDDEVLEGVSVVPFRVLPGDDASCLNLNRAQRPVLVGVDPALLKERGAFRFASGGNVGWSVLDWDDAKKVIPAIADQATALWGLGMGVGDRMSYEDEVGRAFEVEIVGLLAGSVLQGKMIIDEAAFVKSYPNTPGYKYFLIDALEERVSDVTAHLTRQVEKRGLAVEMARTRLEAFLSVQNTYIGIFSVLGGLGVLLGTAGLGVLVARHVLERRGELGLLLAFGFRRAVLRTMVLSEHVALLVTGLVMGIVAAVIAVWPGVSQTAQSLPWGVFAWVWAGVLTFGVLVCALAVGAAVRGRLLQSIRSE